MRSTGERYTKYLSKWGVSQSVTTRTAPWRVHTRCRYVYRIALLAWWGNRPVFSLVVNRKRRGRYHASDDRGKLVGLWGMSRQMQRAVIRKEQCFITEWESIEWRLLCVKLAMMRTLSLVAIGKLSLCFGRFENRRNSNRWINERFTEAHKQAKFHIKWQGIANKYEDSPIVSTIIP